MFLIHSPRFRDVLHGDLTKFTNYKFKQTLDIQKEKHFVALRSRLDAVVLRLQRHDQAVDRDQRREGGLEPVVIIMIILIIIIIIIVSSSSSSSSIVVVCL